MLLAGAARAQEPAPGYALSDEGPYTLERMEVSEATSARLEAVWRDAVAAVESNLGLPVPGRPHVVLAPTDAEFDRRLEALGAAPGLLPPDALAVAFAGRGLVVVRERGIAEGTGAALSLTLGHELAHLALGRLERRWRSLPRWLNEGLAEWASGHRLSRDDELSLSSAAKHDDLTSLEALAEAFPAHGAGRAYVIALGFVTWLDGGDGGVLRLVRALDAGATADEAVAAATGLAVRDAEQAWRAALIEAYSPFEALLRNVTVWMMIGVLALLAIARHVWVRRRLLRKLTREDEASGDPDDRR